METLEFHNFLTHFAGVYVDFKGVASAPIKLGEEVLDMKTILLLVALCLLSASGAAASQGQRGDRAIAVNAYPGGETGNG